MRSDGQSNAPARTRTLDPLIKSQLLYRLSYKGRTKSARFEMLGLCGGMLATLARLARPSDVPSPTVKTSSRRT